MDRKEACMVDLINEHEMLKYAAKAAGHTIEFTIDAAGDEHCWYGYKDSYQFAPKSAPALVKVVV